MNRQMTTAKSIGARVSDVITAPFCWLYAVMTSMAVCFILTAPTLCAFDPDDLTMDGIFSGMVEVISTIALYVGALLAVGGLFSLVMAYKDDNADGQSRAVRLIVIGIVLIGFKGLLKLIGLS